VFTEKPAFNGGFFLADEIPQAIAGNAFHQWPGFLPVWATIVSRAETCEPLGEKCAGRTFQAAQDRMSCEAGPVKTARR
jgi:hypothetical protein